MNAKSFALAVVVALSGASAMAFEATEFVDPAAGAAPAAVTAAPSAVIVSRTEASEFVDRPARAEREAVRAEARAAAHARAFDSLYVGS